MASRFSNSPVLTRLRNSPVISAAKRWAAGRSSPKPQPKDPNSRRFNISTVNLPNSSEREEDTNNPPTNRVAKFARNASPRLKKMGEGFMEAIRGGYKAMQNADVRRDNMIFLSSLGTIMLAMYSIFALLLFLYLPIAVFIFSWVPGLFGQFLTMIPLWAYVISRKRNPMCANNLFLDELRSLSPMRAQELSQQMKEEELNPNWIKDVYHDLRTSWHFTKYSLMFLTFSIIPVVGSIITFLGQTWLVADRMGWNLLSVYTISAKRMSYRQQKHWMRARKWRIIGFTLPYMFLASIPFVGPLILGIAQAATAHIYFHLLSKETDSIPDKTRPNSLPVEFKRAT